MLSVLHLMGKKKGAPANADSPNDRWSQIIESLEEGVIGIDAAGRILSMNQAAEQLTACSLGATRGRHHCEVFEGSRWVSELVDAVACGEPGSVSAEGAILGLWQKPIPVRATASAIFDSDARRSGAALILRDLTLQRNLETDVRRAQSLAQLGVLVAGLAHEIRNPLGGIRGAVQLLAGEIGPHPTAKEYIDLVLREVDRLSKLLGQLLELRPRGAFTPQPVNIHRVIDHVIALVEEAAQRSETRILRFFDPSLPEVRGDPDALTQLFLNLVQNALQAVAELPAGMPREVRLTTRMETDYHFAPQPLRARGRLRLLRVDVEDSGAGVSP
ncbi:MAG TPA: histidine kinase dimerization/phospho-acceptor domain-containing protein, partial [Candidatus Binatia bacterium]|nr:histidine kinase dimerization/phospho-acceptor domain-containing protein [Candidatus Binatia bacterium]